MVGPRPSLFWPAEAAPPLQRRDWLAAVALALTALTLRLVLVRMAPMLGEGAHYLAARDLWRVQPDAWTVYGDRWQLAWLWWQRPAFYTVLWPGAAVSFTAMRVLFAAYASLVPALVYLLLASFGARRAFAVVAAGVVAFHPVFVVHGAAVLFDSLMLVWLLAALLAAHLGRPVTSAVCLLVAVWTKEAAAVVAGVLFLLAWWREPAGTRPVGWPVALGRSASLYLAVVAVSLWPLVASFTHPWATFPGWARGTDWGSFLDTQAIVPWLALPAAWALVDVRHRRLALVAWAWVAFLAAYQASGRAIVEYYLPVPMAFLLVLATLTLSRGMDAASRPVRHTTQVTAALCIAALLAGIVAPAGASVPASLTAPFSQDEPDGLLTRVPAELARDRDRERLLAGIGPAEHVLAVDVPWSVVLGELGGRAALVADDTPWVALLHRDPGPWLEAVRAATVLVVALPGWTPLNAAIIDAFDGCITDRAEGYLLIRREACPEGPSALQGWLGEHPRGV